MDFLSHRVSPARVPCAVLGCMRASCSCLACLGGQVWQILPVSPHPYVAPGLGRAPLFIQHSMVAGLPTRFTFPCTPTLPAVGDVDEGEEAWLESRQVPDPVELGSPAPVGLPEVCYTAKLQFAVGVQGWKRLVLLKTYPRSRGHPGSLHGGDPGPCRLSRVFCWARPSSQRASCVKVYRAQNNLTWGAASHLL